MSKIKKYVLLFAGLVTAFTGFTSCKSDALDEIDSNEQETLGEVIKAQFTVSIPMQSNGKATRMSGDAVQLAETPEKFRGINNIKLFPSSVLPGSFSESSLLGKNITLTKILVPAYSTGVVNYIPGQHLLDKSKSVLYGDVQLQIGTRTFLFYGKAIGLGKEATEVLTEYTADDYFKNGHLDVAGLDGTPTNVSGFKFSPKAITTSTKSDAKRKAICTYLNTIAAAAVTGGETWATSTNTGYKKLYDNFVGMKAGSSDNLQVAIKDLYDSFKDNNSDLPKAICAAIKNTTYVDETTLAFKDNISGYPSISDNLPDGAAVLSHNSSGFSYIETSDNYSGFNVSSITQYAYPASLYYWGKSGIYTSESLQQIYYTADMTWDDNETTGIFTHYDKTSNSISSKTRSVILVEPVQYGVGRLDISVSLATGLNADDACLAHNAVANGYNVEDYPAVTPSNIKLTGVLIGGQKNVGWDFVPIAGDEFIVYDNIEKSVAAGGLALSSGLEDYINYTLVLETPGKDESDTSAPEESVKVALEFVNNGTTDFVGIDGIVAKGTKFYLVGDLDVSKVGDEKSKTNGKVFKQDFKTRAQFIISNLTKAYNTIPDLRNPKVELGLSVNLKWQEGITFQHTFK